MYSILYITLQGDLPGNPLTYRFQEIATGDAESDLLT